MEMQVAWVLGQVVLEANPHDVANVCSEQRRQISVVVKKAGECNPTQSNGARSGGEHHIKDAILAANFWRLNQESSSGRSDASR